MRKIITTFFTIFAVIGYISAQDALYQAVQKPGSVVIDTNTTEVDPIWDDVTNVAMVINFASTGVATDLDIASHHGEFKAMWDSENLYALMDIRDVDPVSFPTGSSSTWMNDGCEIFLQFDSLHSATQSTSNAGDSYQQYRFNYERDGSDGPGVLADSFPVYYAETFYEQDYAFLVIIPWGRVRANNSFTDKATVDSIVAADIKVGKFVSLELSVMQTQAADQREGCMQWSNVSGEDLPYSNSSVWGNMELIQGDLSGINTTRANNNEFKIYPTFVNDIINFINVEGKIEIFDITGQLIRTVNTNETRVNVSSMKPGIYFAKDNLGRSVRFIKY